MFSLLTLRLVSDAGDLHTQSLLNTVDELGVVSRSTVLEVVDGGRLLVHLLGKLSLRPVLGNAGILDGDGDLVRHDLVLDLLVLISKVVSISDDTSVVLSGLLALATGR